MGNLIKEESRAKSNRIGREKEIIRTEIKVPDIGFFSELPLKSERCKRNSCGTLLNFPIFLFAGIKRKFRGLKNGDD